MIKGLVKGVQSGDTIIISGKLPKDPREGQLPEEINLTLTGVLAPKIGNSSKLEEEPYAYESREFLRKMIIGKVVTYKIDYVHNERKFGHVELGDKNINAEIIKNGYAKLAFAPKGHENLNKTELWTLLQECEKQAKDQKLGIHTENPGENNKRTLSNFADGKVNKNIVEDAINKKKEIEAIVEYVFNCAFYSVYIPSWNCFAKINLRFISIPSNTKDPDLYKKGKAYCERSCLSKDVKIIIFDVDDTKTLVCDLINDKGQNLAELVLKEGYSKSFSGGNKNPKVYNLTDINFIRNAESQARNKRIGVWKNEPITEEKHIKKSEEDELGKVKCIMVNSGDSLTVLSNKGEEIRIFLSNLKAPNLAKFNTDEENQPWSYQAKEFLRKRIVGKYLTCKLDYIKTINSENKQKNPNTKSVYRRMKFYTIYYENEKNESKCVNIEIINQGLANLVNYKIEEGSPSPEFDNMMKAEQEAKSSKKGLFSNKVPPLCTYSDLLIANKTKKKEFVNFLVGLEKLDCIVDYCFSSTKFKLTINLKQCMIPFGLLGVKSFTNDKNNSSLIQKYYKKQTDFVVDTILQRDGICDIITADKVGNYFGNLIFNGKNLSTILVEKGLAVINERNIDIGKNRFMKEMKEAEAKAKKNKLGIWENEDIVSILKGGDSSTIEESESEKKFEILNKDIKLRVTEQIDFDKFYCNFMPNSILSKIEKVLSQYDEGNKKKESLSLPIKNGTLCAAKFSDDNKYYRALIKRHNNKNDDYEIEFIDYGNVENVKIDDLIKLDGEISSYPPQAMFCGMAYLKYSKRSMKKAVDKYPDFVDFENEYQGKLCYSYTQNKKTKYGVIICQKGKEIKTSYHAELIKEAFAKIDRNKEIPDYMKPLDAIENDAKERELGVWDDNEETDYDQAEDEGY